MSTSPTAEIAYMPTPKQVRTFFHNFGLREGKEPTLTFKHYSLVVTVAARWYGPMFAQWVADCFMPTGYVVDSGYENSLSYYVFQYPD